MIFNGQNVAAFKLPITIPVDDIITELELLEQHDLFLPHNMQVSDGTWGTASIKAPFGDYRLNDPIFYRDHPDIKSVSSLTNRSDRHEYMKRWLYTEICQTTPVTHKMSLDFEKYGSGLTTVRFLKMDGKSIIKQHCDNNPFKEFRLTIGLKGIDCEQFMINTGDDLETIPMKVGEVWFVDIGLSHLVVNECSIPRYRLGFQYYSPTTDALNELYNTCNESSIMFAKQYAIGAPHDQRT